MRKHRAQSERAFRMAPAALIRRLTSRSEVLDCWEAASSPVELGVPGWHLTAVVHYEVDEQEHWHVTVQLAPPTRPDTEKDWVDVLDFIDRFAKATGYEGPMIEPLRDFDVSPTGVHHFCWHSDSSSPIKPEALRIIKRRLLMDEAAKGSPT